MARDNETFREKRIREEDEAEESKKDEEDLLKRVGPKKVGMITGSTEKVNELIHNIEPLIEQINNLYNMFFSGAEKLPPTEKRNLLESYINQLRLMSKPTSAIQFRCNTLEAYYLTHRDRWDKLMRDMEAGKIRKLANIKK